MQPGMTIACRATHGVDADEAVMNTRGNPLQARIIVAIVDILKALSNSLTRSLASRAGAESRVAPGANIIPTHPRGL